MKYSKRKYIKIIADVLVKEYGSKLKDFGTDVKLAEAVVKKLNKEEVIKFKKENISEENYNKWKSKRYVINAP